MLNACGPLAPRSDIDIPCEWLNTIPRPRLVKMRIAHSPTGVSGYVVGCCNTASRPEAYPSSHDRKAVGYHIATCISWFLNLTAC
eukprot:5122179-Pyramimonas_sp.AAC.1